MIAFPEIWTGIAIAGTLWLSLGLLASWLFKNRPAKTHSLLIAASLGTFLTPIFCLWFQWADWGILPPATKPSPIAQITSPVPIADNITPAVTKEPENPSPSNPLPYPASRSEPLPPLNFPKTNPPKAIPVRDSSPLPANDPIISEAVEPPIPEVLPAPPTSIPWIPLLFGIWFCWSLLSFAKLIFDLIAATVSVAQCSHQANPVLAESLQRAGIRLGIRKKLPRIGQCPFVGSPSLWAWYGKPMILVPPGFEESPHTEAIFCHELAHWARGDHWGALVGELLFCLLPWHPLAWRTRTDLKRYSEEACDDWTIECGCPAVDYAEALLGIAAGKPLRLSLAAVSPRSHLGDRVRRILSKGFRSGRFARSWLLGAGMATATLLILVGLLRERSGAEENLGVPESSITALMGENAGPQVPGEKANPNGANEKEAVKTLPLLVVNEEGQPISGAEIHGNSFFFNEVNGKKRLNSSKLEATTDAKGTASFDLPKQPHGFRFFIKKQGYTSIRKDIFNENNKQQNELPSTNKVILEKETSIGGMIVDDKNTPVKYAKVTIYIDMVYNQKDNSFDNLKTKDESAHYFDHWETRTDAKGRWRADRYPKNPLALANINVSHPDFLPCRLPAQGNLIDQNLMNDLRAEKKVIQLSKGIQVQGKVTDQGGKPIPGIHISTTTYDNHYRNVQEAQLGPDGSFRTIAYPQREIQISVVAEGYGPLSRKVQVSKETPNQNFVLRPRGPVHIRVVDPKGKPIPDTWVYPKVDYSLYEIKNQGYSFSQDFEKSLKNGTDQKGEWIWTWPYEEENEIQIGSTGPMDPDKPFWEPMTISVKAGEPMKTVVLKEVKKITGKVIDSRSGKAVPSFSYSLQTAYQDPGKGLWWSQGHWWTHDSPLKTGKNGEFSFFPIITDQKLRLRVKAPGYRPMDGPEFQVGSGIPNPQIFALEPTGPIHGRFVDENGKGLANIDFHLATSTEPLRLPSTEVGDLKTDKNGHFSFDPPCEPFTLVVRRPNGSFTGSFSLQKADLGTLALTPLAKVKGRVVFGKDLVTKTRVNLIPLRSAGENGQNYEDPPLEAVTDPQGQFEFPAVPAGPVQIGVPLWNGEPVDCRSGEYRSLILKPGQATEILLGGEGIEVVGKIRIENDPTRNLSESVVYFFRRNPKLVNPSPLALEWFQESFLITNRRISTRTKELYQTDQRYWIGKVTKDGSFHFSGVPEGDYDLQVVCKPKGQPEDAFCTNFVRTFTVTNRDIKAGKLELTNIRGKAIPESPEHSRLNLSFTKTNGQTGSLADFRGKFVFVAFRSDWLDGGQALERVLKALSQKYSPEKIRILEIDLDNQPVNAPSANESAINPSIKARLTESGDIRWFSPGESWLIDPSGKVILTGQSLEQIEKVLDHFLK